MSPSVLSMFSTKSFTVSGLTFRSLIHFEFIFVYGVKKCSNFILLYIVIQFSQHHLLKRLSLLHCIFLPPLSKIRYPWVHGFISGLSILFHWFIFLFLCQYHTVLMTVALQYNLKSGRLIPPALFFFLKTALAIRGLLCYHMNCEIFCSTSVKNAIGNFIGIVLNLQIAFGSIAIFTILILHTQEHGIFLHLFMSSLISFISVLYFSIYSSFVSLGRFIPRNFILFVAVENGIDSLSFLSDFSLLVNRNTSDFCVLTLYHMTWLNSLISSSNFLIVSVWVFYVQYHVICKQ